MKSNSNYKNNILLLVIIFMSIVAIFYGYFIFYSAELFQNVDTSANRQNKHNCNYLPWGTSIEKCSQNCMSNARIGLWDKDGTNCTDEICRELCGLCRDENSCQWIASWSDFEKEKILKITEEDTVLSRLVPKQLNISGTSYPTSSVEVANLSNVTVRWNNNGDTDSFMIHYYDMNTGTSMINIETLNNSETESFDIRNIRANTRIGIIVYAINQYGISQGSNLLIVET